MDVAPVRAETGFIVMLPQSLYQLAAMSALASAWKPRWRARCRPHRRAPNRRPPAPDDQPLATVDEYAPAPARRGEVDDAAEDALERQRGTRRPPGSTSRAALRRASRRKEPPGTPVIAGSTPSPAEQRRDRSCDGRQRRRLDGDDDELRGPSARRVVARRQRGRERPLALSAGGLRGGRGRASRRGRAPRPRAGAGEPGGDQAADSAEPTTAPSPADPPGIAQIRTIRRRTGELHGFRQNSTIVRFHDSPARPEFAPRRRRHHRRLGRAAPARPLMKGRQTRAAILDAALALASRKGLEGLSIGTLAEVTEMSKSGVFAHFGSREELQISVVREYHTKFEDEVFRPAMSAARGLPRLHALFDRWVRRVSVEIDSGCIYISGAVEFDDRPGPVRDALVGMVNSWQAALERAIGAAVAEGHLRARHRRAPVAVRDPRPDSRLAPRTPASCAGPARKAAPAPASSACSRMVRRCRSRSQFLVHSQEFHPCLPTRRPARHAVRASRSARRRRRAEALPATPTSTPTRSTRSRGGGQVREPGDRAAQRHRRRGGLRARPEDATR